jgi:heme exporter protein D
MKTVLDLCNESDTCIDGALSLSATHPSVYRVLYVMAGFPPILWLTLAVLTLALFVNSPVGKRWALRRTARRLLRKAGLSAQQRRSALEIIRQDIELDPDMKGKGVRQAVARVVAQFQHQRGSQPEGSGL